MLFALHTTTHASRPGYLLGEFGHLLSGPGPADYFGLLQQRFAASSLSTKALLLSAYAKARRGGLSRAYGAPTITS